MIWLETITWQASYGSKSIVVHESDHRPHQISLITAASQKSLCLSNGIILVMRWKPIMYYFMFVNSFFLIWNYTRTRQNLYSLTEKLVYNTHHISASLDFCHFCRRIRAWIKCETGICKFAWNNNFKEHINEHILLEVQYLQCLQCVDQSNAIFIIIYITCTL